MADKLLRSIKFPTLPDRYVIGDSTLTEEGAAAEAKAVGEALATKADTKGTYEDLIVGGAEQLMADGCESDTEPYLFRTTGGSADVGNREYLDKIVGGTVAWNQLAISTGYSTETINGITFTKNDDGTWTINGTATANAIKGIGYTAPNMVSGHKYLVGSSVWASAQYGVAANSYYDYRDAPYWMYNIPLNIVAYVTEGTTVNNVVLKPQLFDLTAMFGSTIADYIYSLEQSQAGAGVAWFKNYFPEDYYPYHAVSLESVQASSHETVGFNQWDEEWENGWINANGVNQSSSTEIRSKNYIPVVSGVQYYFNVPDKVNVHYFNADKQSLGMYDQNGYGDVNPSSSSDSHIRTMPDNCAYIRFWVYKTSTYDHDICINISDQSRNGEYEPYQKHTYQLDSSLTLRGVPKLADGKLAFDGDVYPPSGEVQRRYGIVDLGSATWTYHATYFCWVTSMIADMVKKHSTQAEMVNAIAEKYVVDPVGILNGDNFTVGKFILGVSGNLFVKNGSDSAKPTGAFFYELSTPTTETAEGYEHYQICDPSGTEEFVTDSIVPVGHETRYPHDLKKKIETAPDSPSTDGTYLMKRSGGKNTYMALPSTPSANGAYVLTVTVSGGSASYSWTAKE